MECEILAGWQYLKEYGKVWNLGWYQPCLYFADGWRKEEYGWPLEFGAAQAALTGGWAGLSGMIPPWPRIFSQQLSLRCLHKLATYTISKKMLTSSYFILISLSIFAVMNSVCGILYRSQVATTLADGTLDRRLVDWIPFLRDNYGKIKPRSHTIALFVTMNSQRFPWDHE
jgi:hypothetical protein